MKCKLASDGGRPLRVSRPISLHLDQGGQPAKSAAGRGEYLLPLPAIKSHFEAGLRKICGVFVMSLNRRLSERNPASRRGERNNIPIVQKH